LSWINSTLFEKVLSTVYGLTTSRRVWLSLENRFASKSMSRITQLKRQLQTLQGSKSCLDYITTAKECADQLAVIGKPVHDDDLITYIIGGLNSVFNPFIAFFYFATRKNGFTLEDFQAELLSYEALLENQNKSLPPDAGQMAFLAQNRGTHYPRKPKGPHSFKTFPRQFSQRR
jgi:hypothetical protein